MKESLAIQTLLKEFIYESIGTVYSSKTSNYVNLIRKK